MDIIKHSTKKYVGILIIILSIILIAWIIVIYYQNLYGQKNDSSSLSPITHIPYQPRQEVATDPNFLEIKGQLLPGFPEFPVYPESTLVASAKTNPENQPDTGYRAKWVLNGESTVQVMNWYQTEIAKSNWKFIPSNDPINTGEQITSISKDNLNGYIGVEASVTGLEIVVEIRINGN